MEVLSEDENSSIRNCNLASTMKQPSHPPNIARRITQTSKMEQPRQVHASARTPIRELQPRQARSCTNSDLRSATQTPTMTQPSHAHNIAGEIACFVGTNVLKLDHMPSVGVQTDQLSNVKTNASINNEAASRVHVLARKNDLRTATLASTAMMILNRFRSETADNAPNRP